MPNRQPKTLRQIMAENLRILRFAAHISQEELAELCGLHRTYNRNISIDNIEKIAQALHITASDLLKERDEQNEDS